MAWLGALAWWMAALVPMFWTIESDSYGQCYYGSTPRAVQLGVGWTGASLLAATLYRRNPSRIRVGVVVGLLLAWIAILIVWMPAVPHYCEGE
jgi:hypothetical protein